MLLFLLRTQREAQNTKPTSEDLGGLKEVELTVRKEKKAEMKYSARNNRYITALIYRKNNFSRKEYTKKIICEMFRDIFKEKEREIKIKSKRKLYLSKELITTKPECPRDYLLN